MKEVNPMKKNELFSFLYQIASPAALILAGLVLALAPDTASALISRLLGWIVTAAGVVMLLIALFSDRQAGKIAGAVACLALGGFLSANPLLLAAFVGRILGLLIALRGIREVFLSRSRGHGQLLALVVTIVGIVLVVLPMTASRLVFSACGIVILVVGVLQLIDRLKEYRFLPKGKDDIIDAL